MYVVLVYRVQKTLTALKFASYGKSYDNNYVQSVVQY